ncbi:hypothetical protein SGRA_3067 [Saprospira grandis str. Lewin]|uniref:Uncharacterized protein n=1 Tax=Saprospira grandis (strain Lewin) TaxID=984262 RepID=H6KZL9_SAPGL|nr:hypothetical protein SGRA_3067 [Saprospira grandis str. Lewin]
MKTSQKSLSFKKLKAAALLITQVVTAKGPLGFLAPIYFVCFLGRCLA